MKVIHRGGVGLTFDDVGQGDPIVLVHGWGCHHEFFAPQIDALSRQHRVVAVDLRGHGASDAPQQNYTLEGFAEDLAWMFTELDIYQPILVGHSMGGNVVLELSARFPSLPRGIVMIDTALFLPPEMVDAMRSVAAALSTKVYEPMLRAAAAALFIQTDDPVRKEWILSEMSRTPSHVLASALINHAIEYDASNAAEHCNVPAAYIGAANPLGNMTKFREKFPLAMVGQTLGSGHFSTLEVPAQINSMRAQFVALCA